MALGNGISIIIFAGIAAGLPNAIGGLLELTRTGAMHPLTAIFICILVVLVTAFVVFVERGQRKILVNYAKRQVGNKIYGGQSSHLPFEAEHGGCHPADLRVVDHPVPGNRCRLVRVQRFDALAEGCCRDLVAWAADLCNALRCGDRVFCFFYTALVFNSRNGRKPEKSGAFILVFARATDRTYIDKILMR